MPLYRPQIALLVFSAGGTVGHSPADSTTYAFGSGSALSPLTSDGVYFPIMTRAGVVRRARALVLVAGTLASAGSTTIRVRNVGTGVEEEISAALAMSGLSNPVNNDAMSLAFSAGDALNIEFTTPAWATNPTGVFYNATLEVELF